MQESAANMQLNRHMCYSCAFLRQSENLVLHVPTFTRPTVHVQETDTELK
jgi:hypothetical protein